MDKALEDKINALRIEYQKNLPNKINDIKIQWEIVKKNFSMEAFAIFHRTVHSLCGSAGTYGFIELSNQARELETYLKTRLTSKRVSKSEETDIETLIQKLDSINTITTLKINTPQPSKTTNKIYMVGLSPEYLNKIQMLFEKYDFKIKILDSIHHCSQEAEQNPPNFIFTVPNIWDSEATKKLYACKQEHNIIVIFIGNQNDMQQRLLAVRCGADLFIDSEDNPDVLLNYVIRFTKVQNQHYYRVLVLDDEKPQADYFKTLIDNAGMNAKCITNPMDLLNALNEFNPDLLLLDLYMPGCTGLELASVLRQSDKYTNLPIIFISVEKNHEKQLSSLLETGADIFLTKPVSPTKLINTIYYRLKRAAVVNNFIKQDRLTNLLTHSYLLEALEIEINKAKRQHSVLSFVMLDIDFFKEINDTYGHATGDLVLKKLSEFLQTRLRKSDILGRYGGEEFSIILPNTTAQKAAVLCESLLNAISQLIIPCNGKNIQFTVSMGIATFPSVDTLSELIIAADKALYKSKKNGRNQITLNTSQENT